MPKFFIDGTITGDITAEVIEKALRDLGATVCVDVKEVNIKEVDESLSEKIWVYADFCDETPLMLVKEEGEFDGAIELPSEFADLLEKKGVCTYAKGYYPNADEYGTPDWATDDLSDYSELLPAEFNFTISPTFLGETEDSGDDSGQSAWFEFSVEPHLFKELHLKQLCDEVRAAGYDDSEMTEILEGAGFAVSEEGQELIEALAESIYQGDVDRSIL